MEREDIKIGNNYDEINKTITTKELETCIIDLKPNKSPGPDNIRKITTVIYS